MGKASKGRIVRTLFVVLVIGVAVHYWLGQASAPPQRITAGKAEILHPLPSPIVTQLYDDDCALPGPKAVREATDQLLRNGTSERQNALADQFGWARMPDLAAIDAAVKKGDLVPLAETDHYRFSEGFGEIDRVNRARYMYAMPHVKPFLDELFGEAHRCFGAEMRALDRARIDKNKARREELQAKVDVRPDKRSLKMLAMIDPLAENPKYDKFLIESLLRTERYQWGLVRHTRWPAARGQSLEKRTTHTTGAVVDIGFGGLPMKVRDWLRVRLAELEREGKIEVVEERSKTSVCAHIMVLPMPVSTTQASAR